MDGLERLPRTGPFILAPNHNSNLDPLVTAYVLWRAGRVPRFLAKASLFKVPVLGAIMRATGQIPVVRGTSSATSLQAAARLVEDGLAVIVYPEGSLTRDPDLWPMRGKSGAVRLALEHDVPLIPCAHWGVQRILPTYGKRLSPFPRKDVRVLIGEPVDLAPWRGRGLDAPPLDAATLDAAPLDAATLDAATLADATGALMRSITGLLEELRAETAPAERWDPAEHGQAEFGKLDKSRLDQAPDQATPDQATPEQATPDQATPEHPDHPDHPESRA